MRNLSPGIRRYIMLVSVLLGSIAQTSVAQTPRHGYTSKLPEENPSRILLPRNSLTVGTVSFFDGFTAVTYERRVNQRVAVAAGAGVTYNSYFMQAREQRLRDEAFADGPVPAGPNRIDVEEEFENRFYHEAKPGLYLALAPKLYINRKALDGLYFAPMLEFRDYRFRTYKGNESIFHAPYLTAMSERNIQRVHVEVPETVRCYDVSAIAGGHHQMDNHLVVGYHVGIGLRHSRTNRQDFAVEDVGQELYRFTNGTVDIAETRVFANFGFSIGGFW